MQALFKGEVVNVVKSIGNSSLTQIEQNDDLFWVKTAYLKPLSDVPDGEFIASFPKPTPTKQSFTHQLLSTHGLTEAMLLEYVVKDVDAGLLTEFLGQRVRHDLKDLNSGQAAALKSLYEGFAENADQPIHAATFLRDRGVKQYSGNDIAFTRFWGLLAPVDKPENAPSDKHGSRGLSGWYSPTQLGKEFALGAATVPKRITQPFGKTTWTMTGKAVSIDDVLNSQLVVNHGTGIILDGSTTS